MPYIAHQMYLLPIRISLLGNYDYVYLLMIDDTFTDQYVDSIINPKILHEHVLYRIETVHGKIKLIET